VQASRSVEVAGSAVGWRAAPQDGRTSMRLLRRVWRNLRAARHIGRALSSTDHPFLVHVVPVRRCNIDCGYCNEYDKTSLPVPLDRLERWLDKLAELGTSAVTLSGGEPLLHPEVEAIVVGIRRRGMIPGVITNGYLLSPRKIQALNAAGLDYMQVSIDNIEPDAISKKSLRLVDRKLQWLAEHAEFDVNVNSVLGAGTGNPEDARAITVRARALGFSTSLGLIHDGHGRLTPLGPAERAVWEDIGPQASGRRQMFKNLYSALNGFQRNLVEGRPNQWRCRAGARYLYVCEEGLVHLCSQQRGYPAVPLEQYSREDIRREFSAAKACAPYCTIGCVHRVSVLDSWRRPPQAEGDRARVGRRLRVIDG
jgi:pyruvate-formate lyase-activating enzyme